jgi:glycosyltransferase involved in cell wall biosynthesis
MEGGANVIVEAVVSGTPVLASNCDGNVGMLGEDYCGYFPVRDPQSLARLISRCRNEPSFLKRLADQCRARAHLFSVDSEREGLLALIASVRANVTT